MDGKRRTEIALSMAVVLSLLSLLPLAGCAPFAQGTPTGVLPNGTTAAQGAVAASWIAAKNLSEVVAKSTVIVIGHFVELGSAFNAARLASDPSQPDPGLFGVAQVYRIGVEQYLKGSGPAVLDYAQAEGYINGGDADRSPASIEAARLASGVPPVQQGVRYLFFLRPMGYFEDTYLTGAIHPSRWVLQWDVARPETPWIFADRVFPPRASAELLGEVERLIAAGPPTPTVGPRPGETSQPTKTPARSSVNTMRGITRSLVDLTGKSDVIVVGECVEIGRIYNGCTVSRDNPAPDPHNFCIQQVYRIRVERYLKGDGPDLVEYAQDEGWIPDADADRSPTAIELAKQGYDGGPPLRVVTRYVLFLRQSEYTNCLVGAGYPDRWALEDTGAVAEPPKGVKQSYSSEFALRPEADFVHTVEQYVAGNVPTRTPTATPRPTAVPAEVRLELQAPRVGVGQTFTVALTIDTVDPVWAMDADLDYDHSVLQLEEVREGPFFDSWAAGHGCSTMVMGQGTRIKGGTSIPLGKSSKVVITLLGTTGAGPTGKGTVFTLRFTALREGATSVGLKSAAVGRVMRGEEPEVDTVPVRLHPVEVTITAAEK